MFARNKTVATLKIVTRDKKSSFDPVKGFKHFSFCARGNFSGTNVFAYLQYIIKYCMFEMYIDDDC